MKGGAGRERRSRSEKSGPAVKRRGRPEKSGPAGKAGPAVKGEIKMKILVINGPNINMLGIREPDIYGKEDFAELLRRTKKTGEELGFETEFYQSNHEGDLVDRIQEAYGNTDGIVINPGAYTHTSVAILDAVKAVGIPTVEVHISDVSRREDFRQTSYIRKAAIATVMGKGIDGYGEALKILKDYLEMMK